jgi:Uma2 family endonuclease
MATVETKRMTAEEFFEWAHRPENQDRFFELHRGEIIEMPPPGELHGILCAWITHLLWRYVLERGRGRVCSNDTGLIVARDPDAVRGPDVILLDDTRQLDQLSRRYIDRLPALVVEVLSPNDQKGKVDLRISQYQRRGIPLIWIVDPEARTVSVYRPGKEHYVRDDTEEVTGEDVLPGMRYDVAEFFTLPGSEPAERGQPNGGESSAT